MTWQFAAILLGALVLGVVLSQWQQRAYLGEVNKMAKAHAGQDLKLVSGRGKGRLRGAVVVFLIDPHTRTIVAASTMVGATIFSRLHPAPDLCGPLDTVTDRTTDKHTKQAAHNALDMLPAGLRPAPGLAVPNAGPAKIRLPRPKTSI